MGTNDGTPEFTWTEDKVSIILSPEQAGQASVYREALEKVGGDVARVRVEKPVWPEPIGQSWSWPR